MVAASGRAFVYAGGLTHSPPVLLKQALQLQRAATDARCDQQVGGYFSNTLRSQQFLSS